MENSLDAVHSPLARENGHLFIKNPQFKFHGGRHELWAVVCGDSNLLLSCGLIVEKLWGLAIQTSLKIYLNNNAPNLIKNVRLREE